MKKIMVQEPQSFSYSLIVGQKIVALFVNNRKFAVDCLHISSLNPYWTENYQFLHFSFCITCSIRAEDRGQFWTRGIVILFSDSNCTHSECLVNSCWSEKLFLAPFTICLCLGDAPLLLLITIIPLRFATLLHVFIKWQLLLTSKYQLLDTIT